jgi:hypothetical protein
MRLAAYLVKTHPAFKKIYIGGVAYDLFGRYSSGLVEPVDLPGKLAGTSLKLAHNEIELGQKSLDLPLSAFATPYPNLWLLSEVAGLPGEQARPHPGLLGWKSPG